MDSGPTPRRIAIIGPVYPFRGGIAHYTACLAKALGERGHQVKVLNYKSLYLGWLFPGKTMYDESARPLAAEQSARLRPLEPFSWLRGLGYLRSVRPEVVVVQWWHAFFAPCLVTLIACCRWLLRLPVVVVCHNVADHEKHTGINRISNWLLARSGARLVIHSSAEAQAFERGYRPREIRVTQHPTYEAFGDNVQETKAQARQALGLPPDGPLCLFFGLVRRYKGLGDLLEALALLDGPQAPRLLVAGEFYEPLSLYEQKVRELGLEGRVFLRDRYVPNEEVARCFRAADVLVAPYRSASQSGVVRIANSFALPVIVSSAGGLGEMVHPDKTGLIVAPGCPEELSRAISRFFEERLAERFRPHLEAQRTEYTWDPLTQYIEQLAAQASA